MPYRSKEVLESWAREFEGLGYVEPGVVNVILQDGDEGHDTGLVRVQLTHVPSDVYVQPGTLESPHWSVTMEPREHTLHLSAADVQTLSQELAVVSALCTFLQAKSIVLVAARHSQNDRPPVSAEASS
ncbi:MULTISPECIES: hypothetical protein [unclassified Pseudoclavibacter]|uniref:hypothetical protein n=1 Tax=unclassified Pseudoclavibacter TaxID=2615177 RepID=UPI0012F34F80|nr:MULTISPECIES: hypothetical protein [unclassified Pseudoclavibacter]MBF4459237.1 hypothetical protein [Pseudoclavibacter sp. VKM Ac-2867]VXC37793.1 conserved hypothetical protein [Pseudoclavibacter sp. 8L]